jgi:acyl-coenzyme A thioesterase PaaI-like protein
MGVGEGAAGEGSGTGDAGGYPPERHVLRDLRLWTERGEWGSRSGLEVVPQILGPAGEVRAGVLATLVDIAGGELAVKSAHPEWIATSDLALHRLRRVEGQRIEARPALVRRSRQTVVLEVTLADARPDPVGLATMTFAVLPAREAQRRMGTGGAPARTEFALPGSGLDAPVVERIGARCLDAATGSFELAIGSYVVNSLGALQGGMVALLVDLAAEAAGGVALGRRCQTSDLAQNYLSLARESPVRTSARVLRTDSAGALVRVETRDASGRLGALASVSVVGV